MRLGRDPLMARIADRHRPQPVARDACPAVHPLLAVRHERTAGWAEEVAAELPQREPSPAVVRQAVLRDLAWLCIYLREVVEETGAEDFEPARRALLDFLYEQAPEGAPAWLDELPGDLVLRWSYRVRLAPELGDSLNQLLQLVFLMSDGLTAFDGTRYHPSEVVPAGDGEIETACELVPEWAPALVAVRGLLRGEEREG